MYMEFTEGLRLEGPSRGHLAQLPSSKQDKLEQTMLGLAQVGFEYLQRSRLLILSGQPVSVFDHPHSKRSVFLCFSLCPLPHLFMRHH